MYRYLSNSCVPSARLVFLRIIRPENLWVSGLFLRLHFHIVSLFSTELSFLVYGVETDDGLRCYGTSIAPSSMYGMYTDDAEQWSVSRPCVMPVIRSVILLGYSFGDQ